MDKKKIFISYSRSEANKSWKNELIVHLKKKLDDRCEIWHDTAIDAGDKWKQKIKEQLRNADVILILLSSEYLDSPWCKTEMNWAIVRNDLWNIPVLPIMVRPCPLYDLHFREELQISPGGNVALSELDENERRTTFDRIVRKVEAELPTHTIHSAPSEKVIRTKSGNEIRVHCLDSDAGQEMDGNRFMEGINRLSRQIRTLLFESNPTKPNKEPDLFVGINHAAVAVAAYLEGKLFGKNTRPLGIVKSSPPSTVESGRDIEYHLLDAKRKFTPTGQPTIIVVDAQFKTGKTTNHVIPKITAEFKDYNPVIYLATLVLCGVEHTALPDPIEFDAEFRSNNMHIRDLDEIAFGKRHFPDFIGLLSPHDIKPPGNIP